MYARSPGRRADGFVESFLYGTDLGHLSTALVIAAVEFVICAGILLALAALGAISGETATLWGATILAPLSITVGYLGVGVGMAGKRAVGAGPAPDGADRDELPRVALS